MPTRYTRKLNPFGMQQSLLTPLCRRSHARQRPHWVQHCELSVGRTVIGVRSTTLDAPLQWNTRRLLEEAKALIRFSDSVGFSLSVASSNIDDSGLGVHVVRGLGDAGKDMIPCGRVVALYAGVYIPLPMPHIMRLQVEEPIVDALSLTKLYGAGTLDKHLTHVSFDEISSYWL